MSKMNGPPRRDGFSLLELMVVVAVIAILAMIALPSFQGRLLREQIIDGTTLVDFAKQRVAAAWIVNKEFPADNAAAGLPPADKIVGKYVSMVNVRDGAITLTFGNQAHRSISGRTLTVRPAYVDGYPEVPLSWICARAAVPQKMKLQGTDATTIEAGHLPVGCTPAR